MMSNNKTNDVGQLSHTKDEVFNMSEAAAYVGVSNRTIERHAIFTKYQHESITRNGRKTKGFSKEWLDKQFKDFRQMSNNKTTTATNVEHESDRDNSTENEAIKDVSLIEELKQDVTFLRKEIEAKNEQILELISSEQKTKMLLADLQIQQKNLMLDKPSVQQLEKKSSRIWWGLFVLLVAVCGVVLYFGITIVQDLIIKIHF